MSLPQELDAPSGEPSWRMERRFIVIHGVRRPLRLVRFAGGWLASADMPSGPTIGANRSPYLAARQALEPLGVELAEALALVGPIGR